MMLALFNASRSSPAQACAVIWPPEVKVSIVAESYSGQEAISAVARSHDICPSQLFTWRRELRKEM
jgi:transposase-like protein